MGLEIKKRYRLLISSTLLVSKKQLRCFCYERNYVLIFTILLVCFQAKGQSEEVLLQLKNSEPKDRHDSIYYELFKITKTTNQQKAKHYSKQAYQLSSGYKHFMLQTKVCYAQAKMYKDMANVDSSFIYYHKAIQIASKHDLKNWLVYLYNDLGLHHQQLDVYDSALHYFLLSYNLAKDIQSYQCQAIASHNLGLVNSYLENYTEAILHFKEAIAIKINNQITQGLELNYLNLARVYNEQGDYTTAIEQLKKLDSTYKTGCDDVVRADLYYGLGYSNLKNGATKEAYDFFIKALTLARKNNDNRQTLANTLFHLSTFASNNKAYSQALEYLEESKEISQEINHRRLLPDIYNQLSFVYDKMGLTDETLQYQKLFVQLKDSIFNKGVANNVKNIELNEQRKQTDIIINEQKAELLKSNVLTILLGFVFVLMCAALYMVSRSLMWSRRYNAVMEVEMLHLSTDRADFNKEIFRAHMEFTLLLTRVTGFFSAPVSTVLALTNLIKNGLGTRELRVVNAIAKHCNNMLIVLQNMHELVLYKNHVLSLEEMDVETLTEEIIKNSKKTNGFLIPTIEKSVNQKIRSDQTLLIAAVSHAIHYFDYHSGNPRIELIFEQDKPEGFTKITVKHQFVNNNILIPYKNQFNHLTVMVSTGKLKGDFLIVQRNDFILFEITIPTDFDFKNTSLAKTVLSE